MIKWLVCCFANNLLMYGNTISEWLSVLISQIHLLAIHVILVGSYI